VKSPGSTQILSAISKDLSGFKVGICNIFSESTCCDNCHCGTEQSKRLGNAERD